VGFAEGGDGEEGAEGGAGHWKSLLHRNFALLISELGSLRSQIVTLQELTGELSRDQTHRGPSLLILADRSVHPVATRCQRPHAVRRNKASLPIGFHVSPFGSEV
jgi:hypothetical protein